MKLIPIPGKIAALLRGHPLLTGAAATLLVFLLWLWFRPSNSNFQATTYHEVKRGDFTVSVVEGGTLAAVRQARRGTECRS